MLRFSKFYFFVSLITLFYDINYVRCSVNRKLSHYVNPGCNSTCGNLIVIIAEGPADILYHVWDFDYKPILLMFEVPPQTNLTINWDDFEIRKIKTISFTSPPSYVFGVIVSNIYEFNDEHDSGILHSDNAQNIRMPTEHFNWTIQGFLDDIPDNSIRYSIGADGYQFGNISKTGVINITSCVFGSDGHSVDLPHLLHTENSSQVDLVIDNFETAFNRSRFAVEFLTFSTNDRDTQVKLSAKKTLDDENTPGVFILDTLRIGDDNDTERSGYLQWRPIVYTSSNKVVSNSTKTFEYDIATISHTPQVNSIFNSSLLFDAYQWSLPNFSLKTTAENVSFGWSGDGFYKRTKYSSWSFLVGIGSSPEPQFSMMVFLIISIGLGLPTLIILGGTAFMIYRKVRNGN